MSATPRMTEYPRHSRRRICAQATGACHLIVDSGRAAFVDTGPSRSVPVLLAALEAKGLSRGDVDYVLLTHIHLDHAGGAGHLMRELPNATVAVHPRGANHLVDPTKLIMGTKAVYGDDGVAQLYGEVLAIPQDRIRVIENDDHLTLGDHQLPFFHTPGHAAHHYCIYDPEANAVFAGDTFGVSYRELDTARGEFVIPATTPVDFDQSRFTIWPIASCPSNPLRCT